MSVERLLGYCEELSASKVGVTVEDSDVVRLGPVPEPRPRPDKARRCTELPAKVS